MWYVVYVTSLTLSSDSLNPRTDVSITTENAERVKSGIRTISCLRTTNMQDRRLHDVVIPRSGRRGISSVGGAEPAQAYRGGGIPRYARNDSCLLPFDLRSLRALKSVDTSRSAIHRLHRLRKIPSGVLRSSDGICVNLYYKRAGSSFSRRCHSEERSDEESRLSAGQSLPKPTEGAGFLATLGMTVAFCLLTCAPSAP